MKRLLPVTALVLLAALIAFAQQDDSSEGSVADLKGVSKVFIDTGGDAQSRESIIQELKASGLGLQIVDSPEGADAVLRFNAAVVPPPSPVSPAPGGDLSGGQAIFRVPPTRPVSPAPADSPRESSAIAQGEDRSAKPLKKPRPGTGFVVVHKEDGERIISSFQKTPSAKIPPPPGITAMPAKPATKFAREFITALKAANGKQ